MDNGTGVDRMAIILFSGTVDKLMAASILTSGGVAMGMEVELFLTNWGLQAFRKDAWKTNAKISAEYAEFAPAMMAAMQEKNVPSWMDNILQAKELGEVRVNACGMTMELFGMQKCDLEDIVDDVVGVAGFVGDAQDAKITLFI
ncbi:MAG TPA: DsrE/DsrF/DrsH-like family protein [Thermomicrobiales bacterium]|nr:DsrE/DsrF/DrsH-like family protein [Thermomicrobiales bacterium]